MLPFDQNQPVPIGGKVGLLTMIGPISIPKPMVLQFLEPKCDKLVGLSSDAYTCQAKWHFYLGYAFQMLR